MTHETPVVPRGRLGVFTGHEAAAAGWTPSEKRHAVETGAIVRLRHDVFASPVDASLSRHEAADLELARHTVAATLASKNTHGSHLGAALLLGWPIWAVDPHVCMTTRRDCVLRGVHVHHVQPRNGHFGSRGGVPLTSPERTLVDIAREYGPESALVSADAAVRRGDVDLRRLAELVDELGYDLDVGAAREMLEMIDPAAESPWESRSRWQMHVHDVPPPLTQVEIYTRGGRFLGRSDFYWREGVVGEVDGNTKYSSPDALIREKWRQEGLEVSGLRAARWGGVELQEFGPTAARLRRAIDLARDNEGERDWIAVHPDLRAA